MEQDNCCQENNQVQADIEECKDSCCGDININENDCQQPQNGSEYRKWCIIGLVISWISIIWNIGEGTSSLYIGISQKQLDLVAYGGQSIIEVVTAVLVVLRLRTEVGKNKKEVDKEQLINRERKTIRATGFSFLILTLLIIAGSADRFALKKGPDSTTPGLIISSICFVGMIAMYIIKRKAAKVVDSRTLMEDANCTLFCAKLALIVIIGSIIGIFQKKISAKCHVGFCQFWWLDPALALIISGFIAYDGIKAIRASFSKDFTGGCGCCSEMVSKDKSPLTIEKKESKRIEQNAFAGKDSCRYEKICYTKCEKANNVGPMEYCGDDCEEPCLCKEQQAINNCHEQEQQEHQIKEMCCSKEEEVEPCSKKIESKKKGGCSDNKGGCCGE